MSDRGVGYFRHRTAMQTALHLGLTQLSTRFNDRNDTSNDVVHLRSLQDAMDRAVVDSYGWTDIQLRCEFILDYEDDEDDEGETDGQPSKKRKPWRYRWPDEIRDEVLGRLLELNTQRAKEEERAGASASELKSANPRAKAKAKRAGSTPLLD